MFDDCTLKKYIDANKQSVESFINFTSWQWLINNYKFIQSCPELGVKFTRGDTYQRINSSNLLANIKSTDVILDVGPAEGLMDWYLKDKCLKIIGVESNEIHYKICNKIKKMNNESNIDYIFGDIRDYVKREHLINTFNKILFFNVHFDNSFTTKLFDFQMYTNIIKNFYQILTDSGQIYFSNSSKEVINYIINNANINSFFTIENINNIYFILNKKKNIL